jgi:hypothetical protein
MDLGRILITVGRTIAGAIFPPLKKKFFDQPKIYFDFKWQNSTYSSELAPINDASEPLDIMEAIRFNNIQWNYRLFLRNNSEHTAYNIKLIGPEQGDDFKIVQKINSLKPLLSNTELKLRAEFYIFYVGASVETNNIKEQKEDCLKDKRFILEYTNVKGTKFYTVFDMTKQQDKSNQFLRKLKKA